MSVSAQSIRSSSHARLGRKPTGPFYTMSCPCGNDHAEDKANSAEPTVRLRARETQSSVATLSRRTSGACRHGPLIMYVIGNDDGTIYHTVIQYEDEQANPSPAGAKTRWLECRPATCAVSLSASPIPSIQRKRRARLWSDTATASIDAGSCRFHRARMGHGFGARGISAGAA